MNEKQFEEKRKELFTQLCETEWKGMQVWEHIAKENLSSTPAFEGKRYKQAKKKIMFVGRALNGWEKTYENCSNLEKTVESILGQTDAFETFVNQEGFDGGGKRRYYHKNSKFFRFLKHVLEELGESDVGIDETWYCDSKEWNQRFVWANLYCISPREGGNPAARLIKPKQETYVALMDLYIRYYKPDVVIFITDVPGWFVPWKDKTSFKAILDKGSYREDLASDVIVATGTAGTTKVIVCKRPDARGKTHEDVSQMAKTVAQNC